MKNLKFLLIPKSNNFKDIINIKEISNELIKRGYLCITLLSPVNDKNLEFILKNEKFDFVIRINKGKPENVKKRARFISWINKISDVEETLNNFNENDLIYTLKQSNTQNKKIKINQMLPAANTFKEILTISDCKKVIGDKKFQDIDVSFIVNHSREELFNGNKEIILEVKTINTKKSEYFHKIINELDKDYITQVHNFFDYSQTWKNDRIKYKGEINNFNYFFEIFRNSKFNVLFEDEYLEFGTNFFNILLVEGTLLLNSKLLNQINECLKLEEDSSNYFFKYSDIESFKFYISNYYDNFNKRLQVGKKASSLIRKKHLYKNRVDQILKDLN